jgi:hypothetical protein
LGFLGWGEEKGWPLPMDRRNHFQFVQDFNPGKSSFQSLNISHSLQLVGIGRKFNRKPLLKFTSNDSLWQTSPISISWEIIS